MPMNLQQTKINSSKSNKISQIFMCKIIIKKTTLQWFFHKTTCPFPLEKSHFPCAFKSIFYSETHVALFLSFYLFVIDILCFDGKDQATRFDMKFIETSAIMKHNMDELLVGVTKQMLLRKKQSQVCGNEEQCILKKVN